MKAVSLFRLSFCVFFALGSGCGGVESTSLDSDEETKVENVQDDLTAMSVDTYGYAIREIWTGDCVAVISGDAIKVQRDNEELLIKLGAISSFKIDHRELEFVSMSSKERLSELVLDKPVTIYATGPVWYWEPVYWVFVDRLNVNQQLVMDGFAKVAAWNPNSELNKIEELAVKGRRGYWRDPILLFEYKGWGFRPD